MRILAISKYNYKGAARTDWHSHAFWQLDYYFNHCDVVKFRFRNQIIMPDDSFAVLVSPETDHKIEIDCACSLYSIKFDPGSDYSDRSGMIKISWFDNHDLFDIIFDDRTMRTDHNYKITSHLLSALLLRIRSEKQMVSADSDLPYCTNKKLKCTVSYIREHILKNFSLAELAKQAGYSLNHFVRLFRQETGMTPMEYVRQEKMKKAIELLNYSDFNIAQIADVLGFPDQHTFSKSFKHETGLAPTFYRQQFIHKSDRLLEPVSKSSGLFNGTGFHQDEHYQKADGLQ